MPLKVKDKRPHHVAHKRERRSKRFLKVYAPYIPLLVIVGCGLFLSTSHELKQPSGEVKAYATDMTDGGLLEATNKKRAEGGLTPLNINPALDKAAQAKADDMKAKNYWAHDTPDGRKPWDFIPKAEYDYKKAAENLAYGFSDSSSTVSGWMNSAGHRKNLMDNDLADVGFGIVNVPSYQGKGDQTVVVAFYGQKAVQTTSSPVTKGAEDTPKNISYLQAVTAGKAPWSGFAAGLTIGVILAYLSIKHARGIKRKLRQGEAFVVKHPIFDVTLIALAAVATLASQTIGIIY